MMAQKINKKQVIGDEIKKYFRRNQGWLAREIGISESQLSRKMNGARDWTFEEITKINKVLGTNFKL